MKRKIILLPALLFFMMPAGQVLSEENIESAVKFFNAEEYDESVDILEEITEKEPSNTKAWVLLGNSYLKLEKNKKAIKSYNNAIRIDAKNEWAYLGLGHAYSAMREHSNAIAAYKHAIEINPRNAEAHYGLGISYDRTVSLTYAFEQYKILKTLDKRLADKLYHIILGN
ncbi:MAG: tetratricopeptide repeat protein [Deltaproteobacteria bacterium]|nr:tetratricopeptide repeat protein [Deltaproteobacteria bacterium]